MTRKSHRLSGRIHSTTGGGRPRLWATRALLLAGLASLGAACDGLLEVDLPGNVEAENLNNPAFARTLVLGAQGDFECALSSHITGMGYWTTQFHVATANRPENIVALRNLQVTQFPGGNCSGSNPPAFHRPLHIARVQATTAIDLVEGFDQADVSANKDFLVGKSYVYRGYSTELLSEAFCQVVFDAGPPESRAEGFIRAKEDFSTALEHLAQVTSGPDAEEASRLRNLALVGRARANLNLGNVAEVVADASQVPEGFVFYADRTPTSGQTRNMPYTRTEGNVWSVTEAWRNLEVGGVPDPRVPVVHIGEGAGIDGITDIWAQLKYTSRGDDIPFASWREAQLMIAEVEGGQTAVEIINTLRETYSLPEFSSSDPAVIRDQVIEERRRELWLQGTHIGDMLRNDLPWTMGTTPKGESYGDLTCIPFPEREVFGNPNL